MKERRWGIHVDHPLARCVREYGAPLRIYLTTPWGFYQLGEKSQKFDRATGLYTDEYAWLAYRPRAK